MKGGVQSEKLKAFVAVLWIPDMCGVSAEALTVGSSGCGKGGEPVCKGDMLSGAQPCLGVALSG